VLNDPDGLNHAVNKVYLQHFPQSVRPRTVVSRSKDDLKAFISEQGGLAVLKPLTGSGGRNVFQVGPEDRGNINQMIEAVLRDGYVIAQEYLPGAVQGDTRVFMMNGQLLTWKGKVAAIRRVRPVDDIRSNMTIGGTISPAEITDDIYRLAEAVRPRLVQDGMFLVGMDVVGDKLMEINVFSPGGLHGAGHLAGADFLKQVICALERKLEYARSHHDLISNAEIATL
jgi:glutathione synthase